jgi:hypothetical protein
MKKAIISGLLAALVSTTALADQVLIIDAGYSNVTQNVKGRLEAVGHTVTVTSDTSQVPTVTSTYQQVWDLRYAAALSGGEVTNYTSFITAGGFAYFVTENPGCCMARNNSVAALVTGLGGGSTQIGPGWANNIESNVNTTYMTSGITVNFAAIAAIVNSQGIPLIGTGNAIGGMSWIGRAGALGSGVLGTIVTVADTNWLDASRFVVGGTSAQQQNVTALDDIIRGIVAGTVGGTISASGNGAAASNGAAQQQQQNPPAPTTYSQTNANQVVVSNTMASGTFTGNGGALQASTGTTEISNNMVLNADGMTVDNNGQTLSLTGSVSGVGGWTFTNTAPGGNTTLNGTYTYTGPTNINNSATVINNSNISSSSQLTNLGTFTNSATGVTGNWINGFNGDGNTAVLNNAGTMGNGTNYSTFNNTGTVGTVQNVGAFNNTGTTGAINNSGTFTNNVGGTVSELAYNNNIVNNNGTITSVTYNGGTVNNNGTIGSINNSEAHGTFNNAGTVSGAVTTNSTFNNTGTVAGLFTNGGTLTNTGTMGDWINNATINNSGTMGNGTNNAGATFTNNSGATVGNTTNTGTFTNAGTVGTLTNTGTLNYNGGTLGGYNQSGNGITVMFAGTPVTVSGAAALGGGLVINNAPTAYGRYSLLNAGSVTGQYDAFVSGTPNDYLRYSDTDVKLYVTPPAGATQSSVDAVGKNFANALNLQTNAVTSGLGNDCATFGDKGGCVSVNVGQSKAGTGDLTSGGITVSKVIDGNWRAGVFGTNAFNNPQNGNVEGKSNPATGGFVTWTSGPYSVQASAATNTGELKVTRNGPEVGVGTSSVKNTAYQLKGSYTLPIDEKTSVTPYVGIRKVDTQIGGYTETGPTFPLTVDASNRSATSVIAGATVARKLTDDLTGSVSAGVVQRVSENNPGYKGSSEIAGMSTFNSAVPGNGKTNASFGVGLSYRVDESTSLAVNAGIQQKGSNANVSSFGITLTKGF